jgi:hypothetical protein
MAVTKFESKNGLVFNFGDYTGGMEREFCAYIFGKVGQCDVGSKLAKLYEEDHPEGTEFWALGDRCGVECDDHGCYRPVSIYHDTDVDAKPYESLIIFLDTIPTDEEMAMVLERAKVFCVERPDLAYMQGKGKDYPLTMRGAKLISNKVERVIKTVKQFKVA